MFRAERLYKSFGSLQVTSDVSLEIPSGRRHGLIGPNGAGKTTLFNLLSGELPVDAGRVSIDGTDLTNASSDQRARAGLARSFQRNNLFRDMTVRENLAIAFALHHGVAHIGWRGFAGFSGVHQAVLAHAELLGMADELEQRVSELSYGTQRQLEIGLALVREPKVLLLDEPTSGMSPDETKQIQALIANLPANLTLLIIEHDMDVIFDLAERITVLDYGRVLVEGEPGEVRRSSLVRQRYFGGRSG